MAMRLKGIDTAALLAEIRWREKQLPRLQKRRARLARRVAKLDELIEVLGGELAVRRGPGRPPKSAMKVVGAGRGRRRRAKNKVSLAEALVEAMGSSAMSIPQILDAVKKKGYKSTSSQFRNIVTQRLAADKRFKRVGRGQYAKVG
jgi:hypothetical protein